MSSILTSKGAGIPGAPLLHVDRDDVEQDLLPLSNLLKRASH